MWEARFEKLDFFIEISAKNRILTVAEMKSASNNWLGKNHNNIGKIVNISAKFQFWSEKLEPRSMCGRGQFEKITDFLKVFFF